MKFMVVFEWAHQKYGLMDKEMLHIFNINADVPGWCFDYIIC